MANPSKSKGTRNETNLVNVVNDWTGEVSCRREVLHGNKDHGDIFLDVDGLRMTWEAKWREEYPSEKEIESFKAQAETENENAGRDAAILSVNLYGKSVMRQEIWMLGTTWMALNGIEWEGVAVDEHSWVRVTLLDFLWMCFGAPSWGIKEL